jgi:hypothetical protein
LIPNFTFLCNSGAKHGWWDIDLLLNRVLHHLFTNLPNFTFLRNSGVRHEWCYVDLLLNLTNLQSLVRCPDLLSSTRPIKLWCTGLMYKKSVTGKEQITNNNMNNNTKSHSVKCQTQQGKVNWMMQDNNSKCRHSSEVCHI